MSLNGINSTISNNRPLNGINQQVLSSLEITNSLQLDFLTNGVVESVSGNLITVPVGSLLNGQNITTNSITNATNISTATLYASSEISCAGDLSIAGTLSGSLISADSADISGLITCDSLTATSAVSTNHIYSQYITNTHDIATATVHATGDIHGDAVYVAGNLYVSEIAQFGDDLTVNTNKFTIDHTNGNFTSAGNATVSGVVITSGVIAAYVNGGSLSGTSLTVSGIVQGASINAIGTVECSNLFVDSNATISSTLSVNAIDCITDISASGNISTGNYVYAGIVSANSIDCSGLATVDTLTASSGISAPSVSSTNISNSNGISTATLTTSGQISANSIQSANDITVNNGKRIVYPDQNNLPSAVIAQVDTAGKLQPSGIIVSSIAFNSLSTICGASPITQGQCVSLLNDMAVVGFGYPPKYLYDEDDSFRTSCCLSGGVYYIVYAESNGRGLQLLGCYSTLSGGVQTFSTGIPIDILGQAQVSFKVITISSNLVCVLYRGITQQGYLRFMSIVDGVLTFGDPICFNTGLSITVGDSQDDCISACCLNAVYNNATQIVIVYSAFHTTFGSEKWVFLRCGTITGTDYTATVSFGTGTPYIANYIGKYSRGSYALAAINDSAGITFVLNYASCAAQGEPFVYQLVYGVISAGNDVSIIDSVQLYSNLFGTLNDAAVAVIDSSTYLCCFKNKFRILWAVIVSLEGGVLTKHTQLKVSQSPAAEVSIGLISSTAAAVVFQDDTGNGICVILGINGNTLSIIQSDYTYNQYTKGTDLCVDSANNEGIITFGGGYLAGGCSMYFSIGGSPLTMQFVQPTGIMPIGIALNSATSGEIVQVAGVGFCSVFSGLTPNVEYFAHGDGSISASKIQLNNRYYPYSLGYAITSTTILLK